MQLDARKRVPCIFETFVVIRRKVCDENGAAAADAATTAAMSTAASRPTHPFARTGCVPEQSGVFIHCSKLEPLKEQGGMHPPWLAFARMSQNNQSMVYAELDVAKDSLALGFQGAAVTLPNDAKGHARPAWRRPGSERDRTGADPRLCPRQGVAGQKRSDRRGGPARLWSGDPSSAHPGSHRRAAASGRTGGAPPSVARVRRRRVQSLGPLH